MLLLGGTLRWLTRCVWRRAIGGDKHNVGQRRCNFLGFLQLEQLVMRLQALRIFHDRQSNAAKRVPSLFHVSDVRIYRGVRPEKWTERTVGQLIICSAISWFGWSHHVRFRRGAVFGVLT